MTMEWCFQSTDGREPRILYLTELPSAYEANNLRYSKTQRLCYTEFYYAKRCSKKEFLIKKINKNREKPKRYYKIYEIYI